MTGTFWGLVVAVMSVINGAGMLNIALSLWASVMGILLLYFARKKKKYRLCGWIAVITIFMIGFPIMFFASGGYKGGVPSFFVFAMAASVIILHRPHGAIALAIECILYTGCCLVSYFYPETVTGFPYEINYLSDIITGMIVTGVLLSTVALLCLRLFNAKQALANMLYEEIFEQNKALERYDRMKSEFLAMVAHEVSTPMTTIIASSRDTLDLLTESPINLEEIVENQKRIEARVMTVDGIITDLMDAVAIENGKLSLTLQPLDLSELIEDSCGTHLKHQDVNNNTIVCNFNPNLPRVISDPMRIEQVILNLLSNAVRHTNNGTIEIKLVRKAGMQIVSVTDNGEGIDKETMDNIFDQYVSTKEDFWRHGMGLHVCRLIIEAHGGEIWVDSEKGCGTSVYFSLIEEASYVAESLDSAEED